jgi:uncharacterized membrane protein
MKSAKIALVVAFVMTVLNGGRCLGMLFFIARSLSYETNSAFPNTGEMQATSQELIQHMQALHHEQMIHQYQIALYGWVVGLAWNLLLAGLLIFAISRIQKSN